MTDFQLSPIEDIIADAKAGKMFILVDDEDRENEGDLVIPAQFADDKAINFMAKHGRGLICLALDKKRVDYLDLPLMSQNNQTRHHTAFTISIEAKQGVTTGISAADRARTIAVAIAEDSSKYDIITPGHIFPLVAKDGGVLVRAGHTEAAVDISRLAGLNASGVICEIMNDDGTMARLPNLIEFAKQYNLKIATIADLIEYRRKKEKLVERVKTTKFTSSKYGEFTLHIYNSQIEFAEHIALVKGDISPDNKQDIIVRMHQVDVLQDILFMDNAGKEKLLEKSLKYISDNGSGVVVMLRTPKKDKISNSLDSYLSDKKEREYNASKSTDEASHVASYALRDYGIGAQILLDLGVHSMKLLTNKRPNIVAIEGYDLEIKDYILL